MHLLLTGAGFTRNWGGWIADEAFEYLLGCPEITPHITNLLWRHKEEGTGFEGVLQELRDEYVEALKVESVPVSAARPFYAIGPVGIGCSPCSKRSNAYRSGSCALWRRCRASKTATPSCPTTTASSSRVNDFARSPAAAAAMAGIGQSSHSLGG
jgi:hypothetical protein